MRYGFGRKLVGDRSAKSTLPSSTITESQFADDAAMYTTTHHHLETMTREVVDSASQWGLTVSLKKTKAMAVNTPEPPSSIVLASGETVDMVPEFTYLGSIVSADGALDREITSRSAKASRVFGSLQESIFARRTLSVSSKRAVYKAVVLSTRSMVLRPGV